MNINSLSTAFSHVPIDWIILGLFAAIVAIDAMRAGTSRAASFALAAPLALLFYAAARDALISGPLIAQFTAPLPLALIFAFLFVALFLLISRMTLVGFSSGAFPLSAVLAGLAAAIVGIIVWLQVPALVALWPFVSLQALFTGSYRLWWLLIAYLVLAFTRN